ncbi:class A beta-lactamase [Streptomyces agglomeratus]|uniref:class A beta-lactamase n=1 Tax=Streptomyces agglomeratus TaxID=285458 RepID=UPI0008690385|nr:class A beta-lactamase [Streptomyces agglomeratus]OEJ62408.1 class A beta-lactamase [Streptomyces agglomeratus]
MILKSTGAQPSRRSVLTFGAGTALAAATSNGTAHALTPAGDRISRRLRDLEREHSARLGVYARNMVTGKTVAHGADERFPMCSTFKTIAVAAVLRDLDHDGTFLAKRIHYTAEYAKASGYDKITGQKQNVTNGMTVEELCGAAISYSDNAAANLLLNELRGPTAVTRFCRSIGDGTTRLDRWEPELNSAEPGRITDTTPPRAIGRTYARLVLGNALAPADRKRLTGWLLANTTSDEKFRAGFKGWTVADKTGSGSYGTTNDVGVVWTPKGSPIIVSVLTTKHEADAAADGALVRRAAELLAPGLA